MVAEEGLLWVGTSVGLVLLFPLPRLDGIPLVSGRACVSFHAYHGRVRSMYPLKNNPDAEIPIGPGPGKKKRYQLFREHETRDACVQTDAGISGASSYAANGPEPARNAKPSVSSKAPQANADDEEEDEDIHSDDEFSFVEDQKSYVPPGTSMTSSPNFSVRIGSNKGNGDVNSIGNLPNQIPDLADTDFVQLMEDFKGFGTSPSASVPEPPDVPAVLITGSISKELDKTEDSTASTKTETAKLENGSITTAAGKLSAEFRERVPSTGQYVKLSEAQKEAKAIGEKLDAAKATDNNDVNPKEDEKAVDDALDAAFDEDLDNTESKPSDVLSESVKSAEYVSFVNSPPSQEKVLDSDSDNEGTKKTNDSYSLFSPTSSEAQSPDKEQTKKIVNLKPKLKFPVLLVTAGEGHLDQRRKKQETKTTEPRIMIWQIN